MLVLFDMFTVASFRSRSLGAGRPFTGSYSSSIALARQTSFWCLAQSNPMNQYAADLLKSDCPAVIADRKKRAGRGVEIG
jgi:hypothetical protein